MKRWCWKGQAEDGALSYAVPLEQVSGEVRLRHPSALWPKGSFNLPPARLKDMYNPARRYYEQAQSHSRLQVNCCGATAQTAVAAAQKTPPAGIRPWRVFIALSLAAMASPAWGGF